MSKVIEEAAANDLNAHHMVAVIGCETAHTWDPGIQSSAYNATDPGHREDSWGLAQIHLTAHTDITRAQATDPDFAIHFMATEWKAGRAGQWTCTQIERNKNWQ